MKLFKVNPRRKRQYIGFLTGTGIALVIYVALMWPGNEDFVSLGPMNTGHEKLECKDCHIKAKGTSLQQLEANIRHALGLRKKTVPFGHEDVDNIQCKSCHDRPNDRHPVHRFMEPRFAEVREKIHPEKCESCHREHNEVRLFIDDTGYCQNCHGETELKEDPLDIPHTELIKKGLWKTCLQCHDFHGNHEMVTASLMRDTIPIQKIKDYVLGGTDPYSQVKKYSAKKTPGADTVELKKIKAYIQRL